MGLIREPDGIDFVIQSKPLTARDVSEIQEWIRQQRAVEVITQPSRRMATTRGSIKKPQMTHVRKRLPPP